MLAQQGLPALRVGRMWRQAHRLNAAPHGWLRAARGAARTKKPRRSGAKFLAGVCPSRGKANPPIHYHSWLRSGDFAEKAPPEAEKAPPEGAGPSWSRDCLMRAAARGQIIGGKPTNSTRQTHHRLQRRGRRSQKKPRSAGKRAGLRSHEGRRKRGETATHTETLPQKRLHRTTETVAQRGRPRRKSPAGGRG